MKTALTTLTLGLLAGVTAFAQAPAPSDKLILSAGLFSAQGNASDMTHKSSGGYGAEVGYQFTPKDFGVDFVFYGGWKKLPAAQSTATRPSYSLVGPHFGFDLVYKPWDSLPVTFSTGPSLHVWQVELQGASDGRMGDQGLKLGWRLGAEYAINHEWSVGLKYTFTEWRSTQNDDPSVGLAARPAYLSLMASYRF
jgi:opacity protein-like surface antigen